VDIKKTRRFETTDRAHADLFNIVIDQLNENDELLVKRAEEVDQKAKIYTDEHASRKDNPHRVTKEQLGLDQVDNIKQASKIEFDSHLNDNLRHIISQERDKWNNAQLFKITSDTGIHKYNLTSGTFYEALKDVGTGTFYGTNAVEDSPSNGSLRGMQLVGQKGIGIGYAIDTLGNAWWFYYNAAHTGIKWFPIESTVNAQLKADKMLNDAKNYTNNLELKLTDLTWLTPTFQNGWGNYPAGSEDDKKKYAVRYAKDITGTVFVEGAIAKGKYRVWYTCIRTLPERLSGQSRRNFQFGRVWRLKWACPSTPQYHRLQVSVNTDGRCRSSKTAQIQVYPNEYISFREF
jgi:hypothetical protein